MQEHLAKHERLLSKLALRELQDLRTGSAHALVKFINKYFHKKSGDAFESAKKASQYKSSSSCSG